MDQQAGTVPQVASIDQGQQSQIPSINDILQVAGVVPPKELPPATQQEHQSNPKLPRISTMPNPQQRQPLTSSVYDIKHARRQNAFAGAVSAIQNVTKEVQQKHQENVAHNVTTVLNAQHQIDSAQQIINNKDKYNPQDVANAQAVLDKNKGVLDRLFSDKKTQKELEKAFDVSFTDPSKNDTPEVKGMIQGQKQFNESKNSGLNVDNPQEKRVQELANGQAQPNVDAAHSSGLKVRGVDTPKVEASASYADQFLKQQPLGLGANPQYAEAVKQQEQAQKAAATLAKDVITQTGANERANLNAQQRDLANQRTEKARVKAATIAADERLKAVKYEADKRYAATIDAINKREELIIKREQTPGVQQKLLLDNLKILQDGKAKTDKAQIDLETEKTALGKKIDPTSPGGYDSQINAAKARSLEYDQMIKDTNLRLSNLGFRGAVSNGTTDSTNGATKQDSPTDGNSIGSDEDPDAYDPITGSQP